MTANQRRPGFRLPWSSETDGEMMDGEPMGEPTAGEATTGEAATEAGATDAANADDAAAPAAGATDDQTPSAAGASEAPAAPAESAAEPPVAAPVAAAAAVSAAMPEGGDDFMRELVEAMRRVADEARESGMTELMGRADDQVQMLEADAEKRRAELRAAADTDVAGIGEWATAEAERIKSEAEQKVIARKARLDQELAADAARSEADTKAVRGRVADYERELEAYHAQLAQINDPAAFAAAAKRLPKPPALGGSAVAAAAGADSADASADGGSNGVAASSETGSDVLAARLAELDAALPEAAQEPTEAETDPAETATAAVPEAGQVPEAVKADAPAPVELVAAATPAEDPEPTPPVAAAEPATASAPPAPAPVAASGEQVVTEVVVKGLGSFGAITGFRQSLSALDGIDSVALSLGQTGEFVFRATHGPGFDVRAAIVSLEGDGAKIENRPEGGLRVTLERAR